MITFIICWAVVMANKEELCVRYIAWADTEYGGIDII